jgi:transcriptional regulator with XRE-family HTH domain
VRPSDFKRWRKSLGYSQKNAAEALGLKRRVLQYYEKGERDGERVSIPKTVRLACYALQLGVTDYHGPEPKLEPDRRQENVSSGEDVPQDQEKKPE